MTRQDEPDEQNEPKPPTDEQDNASGDEGCGAHRSTETTTHKDETQAF